MPVRDAVTLGEGAPEAGVEKGPEARVVVDPARGAAGVARAGIAAQNALVPKSFSRGRCERARRRLEESACPRLPGCVQFAARKSASSRSIIDKWRSTSSIEAFTPQWASSFDHALLSQAPTCPLCS